MDYLVYVVCGSLDYEGDFLEMSGEVFFDRADAVEYGESLVGSGPGMWDRYSLVERVVMGAPVG